MNVDEGGEERTGESTEVPAVLGTSDTSFHDAMDNAADAAYRLARERDSVFAVSRLEVVVSNPRISEYRVTLVYVEPDHD